MTPSWPPPGSISRCIEIVKHSQDPVERDRAMEVIFNRYFPQLLRHAERTLRGVPGADHEAPPQSALRHGLTVLRDGERPHLVNRKQLLVELYRRVIAREYDETRKNLRRGRHENIDDHLDISAPQQRIETLCLEFGELLTEEEQLAFDLHYHEALSISETALRMGCSPRKINTILRNIKDKIRTYLDSPGNLE
jgi:hypothetical protein